MNILRFRYLLIFVFICIVNKSCQGRGFDFSCPVWPNQDLSYLSLEDAQVIRGILVDDLAELNKKIRDPKGPCGGCLEPRYNTRYQVRLFGQARALYKKYHSVLTEQLEKVDAHIESLTLVVDDSHQGSVSAVLEQPLQRENVLVQHDVPEQLPIDNSVNNQPLQQIQQQDQQQDQIIEPAHHEEEHVIGQQRGCSAALKRGLGAMKNCFSRLMSRFSRNKNQ